MAGYGGRREGTSSLEHGEDKEEASVNNKSHGEGLSRANLVMVMNRRARDNAVYSGEKESAGGGEGEEGTQVRKRGRRHPA